MHDMQKRVFVDVCLTQNVNACGDVREEIEDFFDDNILHITRSVLDLALSRRPQLMNMKRINKLCLPRINLSMKQIQKALFRKGSRFHGKPLKLLTTPRAVQSYTKHIAMCVPDTFQEDRNYSDVTMESSDSLHMKTPTSMFLQAMNQFRVRG